MRYLSTNNNDKHFLTIPTVLLEVVNQIRLQYMAWSFKFDHADTAVFIVALNINIIVGVINFDTKWFMSHIGKLHGPLQLSLFSLYMYILLFILSRVFFSESVFILFQISKIFCISTLTFERGPEMFTVAAKILSDGQFFVPIKKNELNKKVYRETD